jgi:hypothetical protein
MGFVITAAADARRAIHHIPTHPKAQPLPPFRMAEPLSRSAPRELPQPSSCGIMASRVLPPFRTNRCTGTEAACFGGEHS